MNIKSKIIIGCMSWGRWGKQFTTQQQSELIQSCVDMGNNAFDHADLYGDYTIEAGFGKAFVGSGVLRQSVQLISKCGIQIIGETRSNTVKHYNYSKDYIIKSVEQSLINLKTDYLDAFLLHRPSPLMHPDEIAEVVVALQKSGKIIDFGVSNFLPSQVELLSSRVEVAINQVEFSLTQYQAMHNGVLDQMMKCGIQPMSWSPLGNYYKEENEQTARLKKVLIPLSEKYNVSEDVILLAWVLAHPSQISPVIGTTNIERIKNVNKALDVKLELEDWFSLLEASRGCEVD